jgi:hypothetical protein
VTVLDPDDNWASKVFSEVELAKLKRTLVAIEENHVEQVGDIEVVSIETIFERAYVHEVLAWLRREHHNASEGAVADFLWALGCNICFVYLCDTEWEYDEVLSDHATYFGARMFLDDADEDDDDLDDDDVDETDDES